MSQNPPVGVPLIMTMRTMLPPNLTRHFYETRRTFLQSAGQESTPWFQLSPMERKVVESEMEIFRQAIRRAEEEQDLLASLDATREAAANEPAEEEAAQPAAAEDALQDCACPGCSAVTAALKRLGEAAAAGLDAKYGLNLNGEGGIVFAVRSAPRVLVSLGRVRDVPARSRPSADEILAAFGLRPDEV